MSMQKLIKNHWYRDSGKPFAVAKILKQDIHPEGLDVHRLRFIESGEFAPQAGVGHVISVLTGSGTLFLTGDQMSLHLTEGVHFYLPPGQECIIEAEPGAEFLQVSSASASQSRGNQFLLRDEEFLSACSSGLQPLRWILTPQYLSRRIFLRHDPILLSKSGNPVSWFRTTMFDVVGLPKNQDGEPVFKMSYNSRTEFNVCYDVEGTARVRMAQHPYNSDIQKWKTWLPLDSDSTYHLNEAAGSPEEEFRLDENTQTPQYFRNKHEVYISDGYVTLFCLFDPAPTGVERHRPGEYSDYEPLSNLLGTELYENYQREIARFDEMVDQLSLAKARGNLNTYQGTPLWALYLQGRQAQLAIESKLVRTLMEEGNSREQVIKQWVQTPTDPQ